ncbi:antibiotic biosynthesis monooxygenase [Gracilibacillus caseinilyticus]|uniref:Antibiotic biosynthesis monooxygenase n=1 Tax=Gracilibacillus caseinilyticus TaxID=2932256 RepID=A0ABY4ERG7_9BACI|nr:antibiotic biosynthesis monooxygenase [Gracilibacillus caseinilyticus]UOQ46819.1 antibiotic biosynthesis monooxygenase [Gracilibacillus caseinilyticus]
MNGYMTNGTYEFLEKIKESHSISPFILMHNQVKSIAYYEDTASSIFETSRNYQVLTQIGQLTESGYISMTHIPVTEEGRPIFEMEYNQIVQDLEGVIAARVLRPFHGNQYILLIEWKDPEDFEKWKDQKPLPFKKQNSYVTGSVYSENFKVGGEE